MATEEGRYYQVSVQVAARIKADSYQTARLEEKRLRMVVQGALATEIYPPDGEEVVHCQSVLLDDLEASHDPR